MRTDYIRISIPFETLLFTNIIMIIPERNLIAFCNGFINSIYDQINLLIILLYPVFDKDIALQFLCFIFARKNGELSPFLEDTA